MRAQGLLPAATTERRWARNPTVAMPDGPAATSALLAKITPRQPYTASRASLWASRAEWYSSGANQENLGSDDSPSDNSIFLSFETLGANRKCIVWFDLSVYGPGSSSVTLGGTGNPSVAVVTNQATGGQRMWIPLALTALSDGRAYAWMAPSKPGEGGDWYGAEVYGL